MRFSEKLDLLMNITNTTNSILARNISMDASFISRLRRGVRTPAKNVNYIQAMAIYLARKCSADYQKAVFWEAVRSSSSIRPEDFDSLTELMHKWLLEETTEESNSIEQFLEGVIHFRFKKPSAEDATDMSRTFDRSDSAVQVLYGVEGKQNAVIAFLALVLKNNRPQTLLLYSDEDLGWLTDNREFTVQWAMLLEQVIRSGNRIKIIHTVNRSFDEMLSAIKEWVPIYMTGSIEPYYYPKTRDGIFRRTLFIAPDTAAVASSSIGSGTRNAANFLYTDKNTVNALTEEYNGFLALCRPLMRIFTPYHKEDYLSVLAEFEDEQANTIIKADVPTNLTMPLDVVESMLERMEIPGREHLLSYQRARMEKFTKSLHKHHHTEIFPVPNLEKISTGKIMINFSDMLGEAYLFYTPAEFRRHLQNIVQLLKKYNNYNIHLTNDKTLEGCMLYVKEDVGVLVGKTSLPSVVFAINESHMTAAFWDYLTVMQKQGSRKRNKAFAIAELESFAARLEE